MKRTRVNGREVTHQEQDRIRKGRGTPLSSIRRAERDLPADEPRLEIQPVEIARESRKWLRRQDEQ